MKGWWARRVAGVEGANWGDSLVGSSRGSRGSEMTSPNLSAERMVLLSGVRAIELGRFGIGL